MKKARLTIDKEFTISQIDDKVFSSFVEPLGRCIYGGIYEPGHPKADEKGFRLDVLELTKALNVTANRFPGGNFIADYRWEDGVGPKELRPRRPELAWQSIEPNTFGLNEMVEWSKLNGSDILMTVNLGTRGIEQALDLLEYCNFKGGTHYSDMRISHGYKEPHGFKYWCLSNETDGIWQIGQKTGYENGRLARETSKAMKLLDNSIKTVLAGSSAPSQDTFPVFDAESLDQAYEFVDYLSVHSYLSNPENDTSNYLAKSLTTDAFFKSVIATCDYIKAKHRSDKTMMISFDEYNTWNKHSKERFENPWTFAPPLLEQNYALEDAVVLGGLLITILKYTDRIKIACLSELVNCISHIRTENGGSCWTLPPYYTFLHFSKYARGTALQPKVDSPKYDSQQFTDVPYVDAIATMDMDENITVFAINRNLEDSMILETEMRGFENYNVAEHIILEGADPKDTNTKDNPNKVMPHSSGNAAIEDGKVQATLPKLSWNVIRLTKI